MKAILMTFVIVSISVVFGCSNDELCAAQEVDRVTSPDRIVDAIVSEVNCGATTSFVYKVFLVLAGGVPSKDDLVFLADKSDSVGVAWVAPQRLVISYETARIFQFKNSWRPGGLSHRGYLVSIGEHQNE
jgi:hypothetical protein